ncbi:MAG: tetrahydromethanopterin S-methyltransferase subunit H family protein [Candidatus Asgardarchaeia archaeon]
MHYFEDVNKFNISNVTFGKKFGETPIVLFGSIFYRGDPIVSDHERGLFDKEKAKELITEQDTLADKFGIQVALDVHALAPIAMRRYLEFVLDATNNPIILDGVTPDTRIAGLEYLKEVGAINRVIYDSISPDTKDDELNAIKESNVECAILLALNPSDMSPRGRISVIEDVLLPKAKKAGVPKLLIDTVVFDIPSLGVAAKAIELVKKRFKWPSGNGAINALEFLTNWHYSSQLFYGLTNALYTLDVVYGADWLFYGPISRAKYIIPAISVIDGLLEYTYYLSELKFKESRTSHLKKALKALSQK